MKMNTSGRALFLALSLLLLTNSLCSRGVEQQSYGQDERDPGVVVTSWHSPDGSRPKFFNETTRDASPLNITPEYQTPSVPAVRQVTPPSQRVVCVLVNATIYDPIYPSLQEYVRDLELSGYSVRVYALLGGNPTEIRGLLQSLWPSGLVGCVLVGSIPAAWFEISAHAGWPWTEEFPADLFYMDLNGIWVDSDRDGMYDDHLGDIAPEIWVGRIDFSTLSGNETLLTSNYFSKVHMYREGQLKVPKRALVYIDDDWIDMSAEVNQSLWKIYGDTVVVNDMFTTNSSDYLQRLPYGYEWVHLQCHGWSGGHVFKVNGTWDGDVYSSDYRSMDAPVLFYQFFVCSGARFVERDYLAGSSIATNTYGLLAVGSTKTGSMLYFEDFYGPLSLGNSIGDSFEEWFVRHINHSFSRDWFYGMTIIGDPTLGANIREGKVEGYVRTEEGWLVSGVRVELRDYFNGTLYAQDYTDSLGRYELSLNLSRGAILRASVEVPSPPQGYFNYSSKLVALSSDYIYYPRILELNVSLTRSCHGPELLLVVDNDGAWCIEPGVDPANISQVLDGLNLSYRIWDEKVQGIPPLSLLNTSRGIFWHSGTYWSYAIEPRDRVHLLELSRRGSLSLVVEGEDIGYEFMNDTFLTNVTKAYYHVDDVGVSGLRVTNPAHPIAQGLPSTFAFPRKPLFLDGVSPKSGATEVIRYYDQSQGVDTPYSALVAYESGTTKVAYAAFPIHWLGETIRAQLIRNLVLWVSRTPKNVLNISGLSAGTEVAVYKGSNRVASGTNASFLLSPDNYTLRFTCADLQSILGADSYFWDTATGLANVSLNLSSDRTIIVTRNSTGVRVTAEGGSLTSFSSISNVFVADGISRGNTTTSLFLPSGLYPADLFILSCNLSSWGYAARTTTGGIVIDVWKVAASGWSIRIEPLFSFNASNIRFLDANGAPITSAKPNQFIFIEASYNNTGSLGSYFLFIEVLDPSGKTFGKALTTSEVSSGEVKKFNYGLYLPSTQGTYTAKVWVWSNWLALGGKSRSLLYSRTIQVAP